MQQRLAALRMNIVMMFLKALLDPAWRNGSFISPVRTTASASRDRVINPSGNAHSNAPNIASVDRGDSVLKERMERLIARALLSSQLSLLALPTSSVNRMSVSIRNAADPSSKG